MPYELGFDALSDPTRRAIFEIVHAGPVTVGEIADRLPVSQPAVSQHLTVLREAKLVGVRREGRHRIYTADVAGLIAIRAYLDRFWDEKLASNARAAEALAAPSAAPSAARST